MQPNGRLNAALYVFFAEVLLKAVSSDGDRRLSVVVAAASASALLDFSVDNEVSEETTRSHKACATDDAR